MAGKAVMSLSTGLESPDKQIGKNGLLPNAELAGRVPLWEWIGDEGETTFSY